MEQEELFIMWPKLGPISRGYIHIKVVHTGELVAFPARALPVLQKDKIKEAPNGHWSYWGPLSELTFYRDAEVIG